MAKKYSICITLNGEPFLPYNKPLSKRHLPIFCGAISFYTRVTIFDAKSGEILGVGHSPTRRYKNRMDFLKAKPWRIAIRQAIPKARGRVIYNASRTLQGLQRRITVCRRKALPQVHGDKP